MQGVFCKAEEEEATATASAVLGNDDGDSAAAAADVAAAVFIPGTMTAVGGRIDVGGVAVGIFCAENDADVADPWEDGAIALLLLRRLDRSINDALLDAML